MKINSEQEMLNFGIDFAKKLAAKSTPISTTSSKHTKASAPNGATIIELIGDVGAGKTTFTRGLAQGLNAKTPVTSPSFTISKSYALPNNSTLIHYDFYRLTDPGLMTEDLRENLSNPNNVIVIEWGETISNLLPDNHIIITIQKNDDNSRTIEISFDQKHAESPHPHATSNTAHTTPQSKSSSHNLGSHSANKNSNLHLYLDTSTPETILRINNHEYRYPFANSLAEKLLKFIQDKLIETNHTFQDITKITFMSGPGSFTGLRIGATIVNTLATELNIPLYDHHGIRRQIIIPEYGRPANISRPKK